MANPVSKQDSRQHLIKQLRERNRREVAPFKELILQNNRLIDNATQLKADNLKLSVENEQLRLALTTTGGNCGKDATATQLAIASMEKKLLAQQEELTELHKRKGENSQLIVDLNLKMEKQQQLIKEKENCLSDYKTANNSLKAEVQMLNNSLEELKKLNTTLLDEHTALQLAFSALEEKLRSVQDENHSLLERLMRYKTKDADKLNEENESFIRKRTDKVKRELEDAAREPNNIQRYSRNPSSSSYLGEDINIGGSGSGSGSGVGASVGIGIGVTDIGDDFSDTERHSIGTNIIEPCLELTDDLMMLPQHLQSLGNNAPSKGGSPTTIFMKFDCHENESHALRWNPVDRVIATGGADRKVKLWDLWKGTTGPRAILSGSSAGINSVDFDSTGSHIIGTSNDYGARVWTVGDNRLRHTLTGHSGKVMAAKYIQEPVKVVTGSYDRTLKIWDLHNGACIATKFAGSSCNDLVTTDSLGSMIISGHYDKRIRFWDIRTEKFSDDILMNAKITSLDLSKDGHLLICSVRDDTIQMLDLRKNQIINTYSDDKFKLSCDWARASINHNAMKIACGSTDGLIYIWDVDGNLEVTLKGHSSPVHAVSWSPNCNTLASVGKSKHCIIYTET